MRLGAEIGKKSPRSLVGRSRRPLEQCEERPLAEGDDPCGPRCKRIGKHYKTPSLPRITHRDHKRFTSESGENRDRSSSRNPGKERSLVSKSQARNFADRLHERIAHFLGFHLPA